jgi:hypothetical protein
MLAQTLAKYAAAGVLLASVFYLVLEGKVEASEYVILVIAGLAALGVTRPGLPAASPPSPTAPTTTEGVKS